MAAIANEVLCFDDYRIDLQRRLLFEKSAVVRVPAKVFDVIAYLALRPESVVTKDELARELWPKTEIGDSNIGQHVYLARKALRDLTKPHRYIATAHGTGYYFAVVVSLQSRFPAMALHPRAQTGSLEALHLYKSARYFADLRTRAGLESSLEFFDRAIELEPGFAKAYAGRALSHLIIATSYFASPKRHFAAAVRDARETQLRDAGEPLPSVILAAAALLAERDLTGCAESLQEALALRENFAPAHAVRCLYAIVRDDFDAAIDAAATIVRIRGARGGADAYLGIVLYFAANYVDAAAYLREVVALHPDVAHARLFLGMALLRIGKTEEAERAFRFLLDAASGFAGGTDLRAHALAYSAWCARRNSSADRAMETIKLENLRSAYVSPVAKAIAYAARGDERRVAAELRDAAELQDPWFTFTPYLPELRGE